MGFVCVYIYILIFIKNGLSKINKRLATKKTQRYREGRRKCPIESSDSPTVPPLRCKSIYTRSKQHVSNQKTYEERKSRRKRKKERRETFNRTILRWIAVSNFFFLLFLCITIWLDCLSLAWDGDGRPYESSLDRKFFPSSAAVSVGVFFQREKMSSGV